MKLENFLQPECLQNPMGRRTFLRTGVLAASAAFVPRALAGPGNRRTLAYVGTSTTPGDGAGNGKGIYLFEMDPGTGKLSFLKLAAETANPTWLAVAPSGQYLYALHENATFDGNSGSVSAFAIDRGSGDLRLLNTVSSHGSGPAYLSVDHSGKFAFVANYAGGSIAVLPIFPNGSLGPASDVHRDTGHVGSIHATNAPPGSFAISGHDAPHAHMILPDPQNRFVLQTDLGQDRIYVYKFDSQSGKLTPADIPFVSLPSGDGPRHFAFHRNGKWMYSIQEEASTVVLFHYDARHGLLTPQQTLSTLPRGYTGTNFGSEIMVSPDGHFLYAANRLHNSIAVFAIGERGTLTHLGDTSTLGDYPRQFNLDPGGNYLYACNQRSDQITSFRINKATGKLTFTGQYTPVGTPACITFLV